MAFDTAYFDHLGYSAADKRRMDWRLKHVIDPVADEIKGAIVLDLGSHDGRWPIAFAEAGAKRVVGYEGRAHLVRQFRDYTDNRRRSIELRVGDFVEGMQTLVAAGETFDVVACLGVYYHTMHHYRMMCQMALLRPALIIIDGEFWNAEWPVIAVSREKTDKKLNTIEQLPDQTFAPIGIPSVPAVRVMAESVGYSVDEVPWLVPEDQRGPVSDYFDKWPNRRRRTLLLRPAN